MKRMAILVPLCLLLAGCPGGSREAKELGEWKPISISANNVCFSVNSKDVLSRYTLTAHENGYQQLLLGDFVHLSCPNTCFTLKLKSGSAYSVSYTLNSKVYYYTFVVDKSGEKDAARLKTDL